jgi:hypothetical protein
MHLYGAIAVSETITLRGENNMKKLVTTLTALTFALGLTAAGFAQTTTVKEVEKPAVKTQTTATGTQVAPVDKDKDKIQAKDAGKTVTKEGEAAKGKKPETMMSNKDNGKKPVTPDPKKEEAKDVTK